MQFFLGKQTNSFWLSAAFADGESIAISILGASDHNGLNIGGLRDNPQDCQGLFQWKHAAESKTTTTAVSISVTQSDIDISTYLLDQPWHATDAVTLVEAFCDDGHVADDVRLYRLSEDELKDFLCALIISVVTWGIWGYEVRHNTAQYLEEQEHGRRHETIEGRDGSTKASSHPRIPTAAFMWVDRSFSNHRFFDVYIF
jgi:hypothetical protein